jgi:uncharacterized protein (DUF1778 family)
MPPTTRRTRTERLNLRATRKQAKLIRLGAKETRSNISNFIVESACLRAEQALASKTEFELKPAEWAQFLAALDRPVQQKPKLRKLLSEPSILEGR